MKKNKRKSTQSNFSKLSIFQPANSNLKKNVHYLEKTHLL